MPTGFPGPTSLFRPDAPRSYGTTCLDTVPVHAVAYTFPCAGAVLHSPSAVQSGCQLLELAAASSTSGSSNGDLEAALEASGVARLLLQVIVTHAGVNGTTNGSSGDGGLHESVPVGGQAMSNDDRSLVVGAAAKALSGLMAAGQQAGKAGAAASAFMQAGR